MKPLSIPTLHRLIMPGVLILAAGLLSWQSLNFYTHQRLFTDSAIFAAVGQHMAEGRLLYREVWDHKPPMIYLINWLAAVLNGNVNASLRMIERLFAFIASLSVMLILYRFTQKWWAALAALIAFHWLFFIPEVLQGGNLTEEYGAVFMLAGMALAVNGKFAKHSYTIWTAFAAGMLFACAVFCKEPFMLSALAWLAFLGLTEPNRALGLKRLAMALAGGTFVALLLLGGLLWFGILWDWLDVLTYNFAYVQHSQQSAGLFENLFKHASILYQYVFSSSWTLALFTFTGLLSGAHRGFARRYHFLPYWLAAALAMDFLAATISGFQIPHYYLQVIPSLSLLAGLGALFIYEIIGGFYSQAVLGMIFITAILLTADYNHAGRFLQRLLTPPGRAELGAISYSLMGRQQAGDTFWGHLGENARYYTEAGMVSSTKYIYIYDHLFLDSWLSTGEEKKAELMKQLKTNPPRYTVYSQHDAQIMRELGLEAFHHFIVENYRPVSTISDSGKRLFVRKRDALQQP